MARFKDTDNTQGQFIDERSECRGRAGTYMTERVRTSKGEALYLFSTDGGGSPVYRKTVLMYLRKALVNIGISRAEIKEQKNGNRRKNCLEHEPPEAAATGDFFCPKP